MKIKHRAVNIIIAVWLAIMGLFLAGTCMPTVINLEALKLIEVASSWFTLACTLVLGLVTAILVARHSMSKAILVSAAYSAIFICYLGYVTINYGAIAPEVAAIGFNVATILQCFSIWKVATLLKARK